MNPNELVLRSFLAVTYIDPKGQRRVYRYYQMDNESFEEATELKNTLYGGDICSASLYYDEFTDTFYDLNITDNDVVTIWNKNN